MSLYGKVAMWAHRVHDFFVQNLSGRYKRRVQAAPAIANCPYKSQAKQKIRRLQLFDQLPGLDVLGRGLGRGC